VEVARQQTGADALAAAEKVPPQSAAYQTLLSTLSMHCLPEVSWKKLASDWRGNGKGKRVVYLPAIFQESAVVF